MRQPFESVGTYLKKKGSQRQSGRVSPAVGRKGPHAWERRGAKKSRNGNARLGVGEKYGREKSTTRHEEPEPKEEELGAEKRGGEDTTAQRLKR